MKEGNGVSQSTECEKRIITRSRVLNGGGEGLGEEGKGGAMLSTAGLAPDLDGTFEDKRPTVEDIIFLLLTTFDKMQLEV